MAQSPESRKIRPPGALNAKLRKVPGVSAEDLLAAAEEEVGKLAASYTEWVEKDVRRLSETLAAAKSDAANRKKHLEDLFLVAHDMKGQGGSFGYDLVTRIGNSLCRFLEKADVADEAAFDKAYRVMEAHVGALKVVVAQHVKGDGGDIGRQLVAGLQKAVERCLA